MSQERASTLSTSFHGTLLAAVAGATLAMATACGSSSSGDDTTGAGGSGAAGSGNSAGSGNGAGGGGSTIQGNFTGKGLLPFSIDAPSVHGGHVPYGDMLPTFDIVAIGDGTGESHAYSVTFKKTVTFGVGHFTQDDIDGDGLVLDFKDGTSAINDTIENDDHAPPTPDPITIDITSTEAPDSTGTYVVHGTMSATLTYSVHAQGTESITATF